MKNKTLLLAFLLVMVFAGPVRAQKTKYLEAVYGPGFLLRQDQLISPFIYKGNTLLSGGLRLTTEKPQWTKALELSFGLYETNYKPGFDYYNNDSEKVHTASNNWTMVHFHYAAARKLWSGERSSIALGGNFAADINSTPFSAGQFSTFAYFAPFSLGAWGNYQYTLNDKSRLSAELGLPLLAWIARSPYMLNDDEFMKNTYSHSGVITFFEYLADGKLYTLNRFQGFSLALAYRYQFSKRWNAGLRYSTYYMHHSRPASLSSLENKVFLSLGFKLK